MPNMAAPASSAPVKYWRAAVSAWWRWSAKVQPQLRRPFQAKLSRKAGTNETSGLQRGCSSAKNHTVGRNTPSPLSPTMLNFQYRADPAAYLNSDQQWLT